MAPVRPEEAAPRKRVVVQFLELKKKVEQVWYTVPYMQLLHLAFTTTSITAPFV